MKDDARRDYLRLALFLESYCQFDVPHFWEENGVIAPFYPFELRIEPVEDDDESSPWKWKATFWYADDVVEEVRSNDFSDHFANEIQQVLVSLRHRVKDQWEEVAQKVRAYLYSEHRIKLHEIDEPYEKVDKQSPHHNDIMTKHCMVEGDVTDFEYEIILYVFESKDPVLILHSEKRDVYSLHPEDEAYKDLIDRFMDTVSPTDTT